MRGSRPEHGVQVWVGSAGVGGQPDKSAPCWVAHSRPCPGGGQQTAAWRDDLVRKERRPACKAFPGKVASLKALVGGQPGSLGR